jgi:hypothetical protein
MNVPFDIRYTYMTGGVNTNAGWETYNTPTGAYALLYMQNSSANGFLPQLTYYEMLNSQPSLGGNESARDLSNLNNASTMNAYFQNFKLLLTQCATYGKPVIVHIEPDMWGYIEQQVDTNTNSATDVPAAVNASGWPDAAGLPDNVQGYALTLLKMAHTYAPNVIMAIHFSEFGPHIDLSNGTTVDINAAGARAVAFLKTAGASSSNLQGIKGWDLFYIDPSDRDADFNTLVRGQTGAFWDDTNFARYRDFIGIINRGIGLRCFVWQIPCGNTFFRTCNDTTGHYQDNRPQYFLEGYPSNTHMSEWAANGVIGLLFGAGSDLTTTWTDHQKDGITNPGTIPSNNLGNTSSFADDDGGYLRLRCGSYYTSGKLSLP